VIKQYMISEAYANNVQIDKYIDGEIESKNIVSEYNQEGFCRDLENMEYTRAYSLMEAEKELKQAEKDLTAAKGKYGYAYRLKPNKDLIWGKGDILWKLLTILVH